MTFFQNRQAAGRQLAARLSHLGNDKIVLLAIPRGGIPVAAAVAGELQIGFSILPLRRLVIPWRLENDYGYVTSSGELHLNRALVGQLRLTPQEIYRTADTEKARLLQDLEHWGVPQQVRLDGQTGLIISDGMHSGWAMYSAVATVKKLGAGKIVAAVPVSHFRAQRFLEHHCDEVVCLIVENIPLFCLENYYEHFAPVTDEEIKSLMPSSGQSPREPAASIPV
jgi:predicted phosphoribosyltransferase